MRLYICSTYYHVYITLLKQFAAPEDTDLVICDDMPTGESLTERLSVTRLFHHVWYVEQSKLPEVRGKNRLDWVLFQHRRRFRIIRPMLPFDLDNYQDIYIFHDGTPLGMYLTDAKRQYHLIEDALNLYQRILDTAQAKHMRPHNLKFIIRQLLNSGYFQLGESRYVLDVEVNENKGLQMKLPNVKEVPRKGLQERLTEKEKQILLEVFGCPSIAGIGENTAVVLTEPLYADGLCETAQEQVDTYCAIARALKGKGYIVVIKPHPRDREDYTSLNVQILERGFPVELFQLLPGNGFACAATVSSTAIYEFQAARKLKWISGVLAENLGIQKSS